MAIILCINTGFKTASVILSAENAILAEEKNEMQKDHAFFLEPAIQKVLRVSDKSLNKIDAVCVVNGPGSYTGLRVGLSSAKALCYVLQKPLILLNTLDVMANALHLQTTEKKEVLFCPLIDARRMEVYTALYNEELKLIKPYSAEILNEDFLQKEYQNQLVITGGDGSLKLQQLTNNKKFIYINPLFLSLPIVNLSMNAYNSKIFANTIYCEPFYLKPVYFKK